MQSFLSRFKDKLNADYGGRYVAAVLAEAIQDEPRLIEHLWGRIRKPPTYTITTEWCFDGQARRRFADLAILDKDDRPIALLEVKYEDHKSTRNSAQLDDYLKFCRSNKRVSFKCFTKHQLPDVDLRRIGRPRQLSYAKLVRALEGDKRLASSPICNLLCRFFREEGEMFNQLDQSGLEFFIRRLSGYSKQGGGRPNTY